MVKLICSRILYPRYGGGNLMFWGCFSSKRIGLKVKIDGNIWKKQYIAILNDILKEAAMALNLLCCTFMHDSEFLETNSIDVLIWPDQSSLEKLWGQLKVVIWKRNPELVRIYQEKCKRRSALTLIFTYICLCVYNFRYK